MYKRYHKKTDYISILGVTVIICTIITLMGLAMYDLNCKMIDKFEKSLYENR